ncbi:MAG: hypothetical protein UHP28_08920 [Treponema sp.]|nr:hypothetical protein [Treponema sp.]
MKAEPFLFNKKQKKIKKDTGFETKSVPDKSEQEGAWWAMEADEPFLPFFWSAPGMEWCVAGEPKLALATPSVSGPWNARCEMICAKM